MKIFDAEFYFTARVFKSRREKKLKNYKFFDVEFVDYNTHARWLLAIISLISYFVRFPRYFGSKRVYMRFHKKTFKLNKR